MTTMNISLPESMKAFVEAQAMQEGYGTVSEYLCAVIRDLRRRKVKKAKLAAQLLEGGRSPTVRMTKKRWRDLEERIKKRGPKLG